MFPQEEYGYPLEKFLGTQRVRSIPSEHPFLSGKTPPHSTEAEIALLGAMFLDRGAIARTIEILDAAAFYHDTHRKIFEAILALFERGVPVDVITVADELRRRGQLEYVGGTEKLVQISTNVVSAAAVEHHARIVLERHLKRQLLYTAAQIIEQSFDESSDALELIDHAESQIFSLAEKRLGKSYTSINRLARATFELITRLHERGLEHGISGLPTGFVKLDELLGGLQRSDLIIIAARPSMGKTALALSIARNMAVEFKIPVGFFSIEMAGVQIVMRLLSAEAKVNAHSIRTGRLTHDDITKIVKTIGRIADAPIFIDDSPSLTLMELRAKARRLKAEHDVQVIFVDYLQLIHAPKAESREREISIISRTLKQIAKELDIPIVALAQLNRSVESRADKRPMLSDLRESGSIEQDSDVVIFVTRPEVYEITTYDDGSPTEGTAELIVAKQRNGPIGTVRTAYLKDFARFENLALSFDEPMPGTSF
ncbi:MAG: replicative DNA helicase [Bacteroidota bacterium]|nr:replicative DNA helicase [Bacteroidota bacterium]MDW8271126.1 replicative DNA helicase [Bacteroidota bacterium]